LILVINAIVGVWQESNAENALEALKDMQAVESRVLRNGEWNIIDAKLLVTGDVVEVRTGDKVPADLRMTEMKSIRLQVEEAALTGESQPVEKQLKIVTGDSDILQEQHNMLFSSTQITYGSAKGVVISTGMSTAIGQVQQEVEDAGDEEEATPLKKKLDEFGELLSKIITVICFLVWIMNVRNFFDEIHGSPLKGCIYYLKIAIALAVAAIPEGLPAVITTCLALGTRKMAAHNAIVRSLPSV
jgi:Ca2+-transporting ATPase